MPKSQLNIRIDDATRDKLNWLVKRYDTKSKAMAVAIALLYLKEQQDARELKAGRRL